MSHYSYVIVSRQERRYLRQRHKKRASRYLLALRQGGKTTTVLSCINVSIARLVTVGT
jgi:hypothetical protein